MVIPYVLTPYFLLIENKTYFLSYELLRPEK